MPLFKLPGIHVPHHKNTDKMKAVRMPIPKEVILQMIELASNWNINEIKDAKYAFENRKTNKELWTKTKEKYCDFILDIKKLWDECEEEIGDLRDEIFF